MCETEVGVSKFQAKKLPYKIQALIPDILEVEAGRFSQSLALSKSVRSYLTNKLKQNGRGLWLKQ
jgi:hypothetical protein